MTLAALIRAAAMRLKEWLVPRPGMDWPPHHTPRSSWLPTDSDPQARFYRADKGVTSSGSATRWRAGVQSRVGPEAPDASQAGRPIVPVDGQGIVELASGRLLLLGGAPFGHGWNLSGGAGPGGVGVTAACDTNSVNTIWYSDDRGKTWPVLLASGAPSSTRPKGAHTFGCFTMTIAGVEYVYWVGGDPFKPTGDVFRSADGGSTWARISTTCPTSGLALYMYGVIHDTIFILNGQVSVFDGAVSNQIWASTDHGVTWTNIGTAPMPGRSAQLQQLPEMGGFLWFVGGARYHDHGVNTFYNDVWKWNGATTSTAGVVDGFTRVLADGHAQFPRSRYHSVVNHKGRLWRFNGSTYDVPTATLDADTATAFHSADGATWTAWTDPLPWGDTHAQAAISTADGVYLTEGFQSRDVFVIREHTGQRVSAWADQGTSLPAKTLLQASPAMMPILDMTAMGGRPGIVFTGAQMLQLAAPDVNIPAPGFFEVWFIGKTLNFLPSVGGANPACTVVGAANASSWNNFGFAQTPAGDDGLEYRQANAGWVPTARGAGFSDDGVRTFGVQHQAGSVKLFADGVQVGTTDTGSIAFNSAAASGFTGWDAVGAGSGGTNFGAFVVSEIVVRRVGAPWGAPDIARMAARARLYKA